MTLRIEKVTQGRLVIFRLSGRFRSEHIDELKEQIKSNTRRVILDLGEARLVDQDAVRFLAACEAKGVELSQCSLYIRNSIDREKTKKMP